jgi:hypothetical protein
MAAASADPTPRGKRAAVVRGAGTACVRPAIAAGPACVPIASVGGAARGLMASAGGAARELMASAGGTAHGLIASVGGTACVLLVSGAATLVTQAGLGQRANALWMSALALATMTIVPLVMSRISRRHTTFATAVTLIATMSAMSVVPAYVSGLEHRTEIAALAMTIGGVLLAYGWRLVGAAAATSAEDSSRKKYPKLSADESTKAIRATGATALLALLAGLSSGSLARFQLYAICGMSGAQPIWQIAFSLGAVCALALITDRSGNNNWILIVLYMLRAALIGTLAAVENPTLALLAAKIFLVLDCLTIPALMKPGGKSRNAMSAGCPGAAHHIGMVLGATLSTTPYFFGDGFILLYALSAMANLTCAASLATRWIERKPFLGHLNHHHRQADSSAEHEVQVGKYDSFVTEG